VIHPPLPRFHGAWGLLGAALVPGLVLAPDQRGVLPLAGAILLGFMALGSLERGGVSPRARRHLPAWVTAYALASVILFGLALPRVLARTSFLFPALAGALLAALRLLPPLRILRRPAAREALGMGLLGLALPALLIAGGAPARPAAALYLLYTGFFGIRLAFVRAHLAGRAAHAVSLQVPLATSGAAAFEWAIAIIAFGLDAWLIATLIPILLFGFIRLARDRHAERAIRTLGLEELASVAAFAAVVILLGGRTLSG
jgi:hypothetical protein